MNSAYLLAEHTQEYIELLIIEWNPPDNKRQVYDVLVRLFSAFLGFSFGIGLTFSHLSV